MSVNINPKSVRKIPNQFEWILMTIRTALTSFVILRISSRAFRDLCNREGGCGKRYKFHICRISTPKYFQVKTKALSCTILPQTTNFAKNVSNKHSVWRKLHPMLSSPYYNVFPLSNEFYGNLIPKLIAMPLYEVQRWRSNKVHFVRLIFSVWLGPERRESKK